MPLTRTLDDPILKHFRSALDRIYRDHIERVALYGSRARSDARPDSDYVIAVSIKTRTRFPRNSTISRRSAPGLPVDTGCIISAKPFRAGAYRE